MNRQEIHRDQYRKLKPAGQDSVTIYKNLIAPQLEPGGCLLDLGSGHTDFLFDIIHRKQIATVSI